MQGIFGERYASVEVIFDGRVEVIPVVVLAWLFCGGFQRRREISCGIWRSLVVNA